MRNHWPPPPGVRIGATILARLILDRNLRQRSDLLPPDQLRHAQVILPPPRRGNEGIDHSCNVRLTARGVTAIVP